jgi:hypothetical protein
MLLRRRQAGRAKAMAMAMEMLLRRRQAGRAKAMDMTMTMAMEMLVSLKLPCRGWIRVWVCTWLCGADTLLGS